MDSRIAKVEEAQKDLLNRMHNEYEELVNNIEKIMRKSQLKFVENLQSMVMNRFPSLNH